MGRVKSIAQKRKKTATPPVEQPAPQAENPSTSPQSEKTSLQEIQIKACLQDVLRPKVEWYVAPPSNITARMDVRETTAGSATGEEVPDQHHHVSQPSRRRTTGVTIREPSNTLRAAAAPAPPGKGKQKASEHHEPTLEAFDLYTNPTFVTPASRKKSNRCQPGEGCSDPSVKRARTEDPPAPTPSKETTPPPSPTGQTPPAPIDQNPSAPANPSPATQPDKTLVEAILNSDCTSASDRLKKLSRHRHSLESFNNTHTMPVGQLLSRGLNELLTGILTVSTSWRCSEEVVAKKAEEIKAAEERLVEEHKVVEAKHTEELRVAEAKIAKLEEELKKKADTVAKITASKDKYKEASLINYREAHKLQ
ncbi:uncharacterized protein LOC133806174 [Humulus lupulus]|uniref:uncharacterized protein LOC133806174 n=1 Tax=Humulus lupulus TaxID=3486 RepID=UPI002B414055|nr:uncharacterized protein LOC133806174 [Humulus lupulus]